MQNGADSISHSCAMPPDDKMWEIARGNYNTMAIPCEWANWAAAIMGKDHIYKFGGTITVEAVVDLHMACMKVLSHE